jgi:hypothetical protein
LVQATRLKENSMKSMSWVRTVSFTMVALGVLAVAGCGGTGRAAPDAAKSAAPAEDACAVAGWCTEHGVPEEICAQCNAKVAAEYKKNGDWCTEHNRPKSQCFVCNPKLEAKFAAEYEMKYGKKPPAADGK